MFDHSQLYLYTMYTCPLLRRLEWCLEKAVEMEMRQKIYSVMILFENHKNILKAHNQV